MVSTLSPDNSALWTVICRCCVHRPTALLYSKMTFEYFVKFPYTCIKGFEFKDRQQEAWPVLVPSGCNGDYYIPLEIQHMYCIPFISLVYGLFIDIKHVKSHELTPYSHAVSLNI